MSFADRISQQLGNYHLRRLLGQGGFAAVYLGEHIHLGTVVAIKILHTRVSPNDVAQFQQEARLLATLKHPFIVRVLDFGLDGQTPYLVMEYAPHGTLRTRHPRGSTLPLSTIVGYVKQITEALQYAHNHNIVHRDIKPENMLIGEQNEILLSDFGIALITQSIHYQSTKDMAGTSAYMAPEQTDRHPRPASDQYALGIVVYEWLCGTLPFEGSYIDVAIKHRLTSPPPLHTYLPALSPTVENVVMKALAKNPQERFASVKAFAIALEQASQDAPTMEFQASDHVEYRTELEQPNREESAKELSRLVTISSRTTVSRRSLLIGATAAALVAVGGTAFAALRVFNTSHDTKIVAAPSPTAATSHPTSTPEPTATPSPAADPTATPSPQHDPSTYVSNLSDDGIGSLRWTLANAPDGSTITFDPKVKGIISRPSSTQCRDLLISKNLTVRGPGAELLAISGGGHDRVFSVSSGFTVTISDLTIKNGTQGCTGYPGGGGIYNEGTLILNNCIIANNSMPDGQGGGIDNEGSLTLTNCKVTGNSGANGQNTKGGGIYNGIVNSQSGGTSELTLNNTTISGNTATGDYGDSGFGGGIYNAKGSKLTLNNSTISNNSATGPASKGGGIYNEGTLLLNNSIVSGNSAAVAKSFDIYNIGTIQHGK